MWFNYEKPPKYVVKISKEYFIKNCDDGTKVRQYF
jgi:hypothetical protein